jgi:hypothetical protein
MHYARARIRTAEAGTASLEALLCLPFIFLVFALVLDIGYGWVVRLRADAAIRYAGTNYVNLLSQGVDPATALGSTEESLRHRYYPAGEDFRLEIDTATLSPQAAAPPPGPGMVWANPDSMIFHRANDRWYGRTRNGRYMTEDDAVKAGYREARVGWWSGQPGDAVPDLETGIREHGGEPPSGSVLESLRTLGARLSERHDLLLSVPRHVPTRTLLPDTPLSVTFSIDGNTWTYHEIPLSFDALTDVGAHDKNLPAQVLGWGAKGLFWLLGMKA